MCISVAVVPDELNKSALPHIIFHSPALQSERDISAKISKY